MASILLPYGMRVVLEYTLNGEAVINVYHVIKTTPVAVLSLDLPAVAAIFNTFRLGMRPVQSAALSMVGIEVTDISVVGGFQYNTGAVATPGGTNVADATPNNVAICVSLQTARSGRSFHGRSYQAGVTETMLTSLNLVTAATATTMLTQFDNLRANLLASNYALVVASYFADKVQRTEVLPTPVLNFSIDSPTDSQRRRLPGRGN